MIKIPEGMQLPRTLDDVNAAFMTGLLRGRGLLSADNEVTSTDDQGVGMTAGYFSSIKRVKCHFKHPTDAPDSFVVKTWPDFELAPKEQIAGMFEKDIIAYTMPSETFYPRPQVYLADFDAAEDRWALLMDDANAFGTQKLHETEMTTEEVLHMVPKLVEVAVAWEGCHEGEKSKPLDQLGIVHWASDENLAAFRQIMPGGAPLYDIWTSMSESTLINGYPWDKELGPNFSTLFTNKLEAFYEPIRPENGGTCTLVHGDLRGDNLFFCPESKAYPNGWLTIDFQLMTRGPIPSDLAYLMNTGTVLPEVYDPSNRDKIMARFFEAFMDQTSLYKQYTYEQFRKEYMVMSTVLLIYYIGFGANIWQAGLNNEQASRVEMGDKGETEADLTPEERRQRMWWRKATANFRVTFKDYGVFEQLSAMPDNQGEMGPWLEVPERLRNR